MHHYKECINEVLQSKQTNKQKEQLYLERGMSGLRLGAGLQQVRDGAWFLKDETPDNSTLQPIAFATKCLTSTET